MESLLGVSSGGGSKAGKYMWQTPYVLALTEWLVVKHRRFSHDRCRESSGRFR